MSSVIRISVILARHTAFLPVWTKSSISWVPGQYFGNSWRAFRFQVHHATHLLITADGAANFGNARLFVLKTLRKGHVYYQCVMWQNCVCVGRKDREVHGISTPGIFVLGNKSPVNVFRSIGWLVAGDRLGSDCALSCCDSSCIDDGHRILWYKYCVLSCGINWKNSSVDVLPRDKSLPALHLLGGWKFTASSLFPRCVCQQPRNYGKRGVLPSAFRWLLSTFSTNLQ